MSEWHDSVDPNEVEASAAELLRLVKLYYDGGMRVAKLNLQPAPWILRGLQKLEAGEELTVEDIVLFQQNQ